MFKIYLNDKYLCDKSSEITAECFCTKLNKEQPHNTYEVRTIFGTEEQSYLNYLTRAYFLIQKTNNLENELINDFDNVIETAISIDNIEVKGLRMEGYCNVPTLYKPKLIEVANRYLKNKAA